MVLDLLIVQEMKMYEVRSYEILYVLFFTLCLAICSFMLNHPTYSSSVHRIFKKSGYFFRLFFFLTKTKQEESEFHSHVTESLTVNHNEPWDVRKQIKTFCCSYDRPKVGAQGLFSCFHATVFLVAARKIDTFYMHCFTEKSLFFSYTTVP